MAEQVFDNQKFTDVRLPKNLNPIYYRLSLKPNLDTFTFEGTVEVEFEGEAAANVIVLHAHELDIIDGSVDNSNALTRVTYSKDTEAATLEFKENLPNKGNLLLHFKGTLNDKLKGFYRTSFKIQDTLVYAATTQFEATDARRCFPCWDEPAIKAEFEVTITYDPIVKGTPYERIALSNTPEISRSVNDEQLVVVKFDKTPKISTYLLAFIVGPFEMIESTDGKRPIRVYTTPGKQEQGRYALEVACKSLPYYENYFNVPYPLKKMDLIAIPDFNSGAMENWGLVTYRETCLLVDPNNTATAVKQYVALVVAHELAHQWFGNLVTMEWWTHLWLNEGFASFMEYLCVDYIFPEYDIWSQFSTDAYGTALELDSLHNSHPIEVPVKHPSEIDEIFDSISYNKGASVIRMLYNYIGDESFRLGMKEYLLKFAYRNASTEDLWDSLEKASGKPVRKLMSGWTSQKGYPWLSVAYSHEGDQIKLSLTQSKFTADGKLSDDEAHVRWMIPVSAIASSDPSKPAAIELIGDKTGAISIRASADNWVKLNPGHIGLYRTAYPEELMKKLWPSVLDQSLPAMDRLGLQNDFFALCQAGKVQTVELLRLLEVFVGETNYTVWKSIDGCLGRLNILLSNTDYQDKFHQFGRKLYSEIYKKLTWSPNTNEKHTDAMTRALIINRLVSFGDESVIAEALRRYKAQLENIETVPADLRGAVYRAASVYGDELAFDNLFEIYKKAELHEEKDRVGRVLGSTKDPNRIKRVIEFALSDEVRIQDKVWVIIPMSITNPSAGWKFLQDYKDLMRGIYESGHQITYLVKYTTENFATEEKALDIEKFFEENKFPGAERTIQQSVEKVRLNASWLERDSKAIKVFLS